MRAIPVQTTMTFCPSRYADMFTIVFRDLYSNDDDDGSSEKVTKKINLRYFKLNRVYLDPLNISNAGDFSWS